jgi:hypothetical protein
MNVTQCFAHRFLPALALAAALCLMAGCDGQNAARVKLHVRPSPSEVPTRLEIQAQIAGTQTGLHYKWFAVSGACDPQESDSPTTVFQFAESVTRDRVSVEVWRGDRRIGQSDIDVKFDEEQARLVSNRSPQVQIEITTIPPAEAGGPDTQANIAGKVSGKIERGDKVLLYAYAYDYWHIQPIAHAMHPIGADNTWSNWTHTGTSYAALVVKEGYEPRIRLDVLPRVSGSVLARSIVEGRRQ